jgi:Tfp pilus assembly protein PilF
MSELASRYFEKALDRIKGRDYDRALVLLVEAIKLKPDFTEAWTIRGNVLHALERPFDALLHYDRAIALREDSHDAWNNRGRCFADIGMWASAEESFLRSAVLCEAVEPHMGLANMWCTLNRLEDAAREYRSAIAIEPGFADAHFNLGCVLLGLGQWTEGWVEYEWRHRNTVYPPRAYRDHEKWTGQDLSGKRILLYPEQGYGDEIMALRFALALANRRPGTDIIVQARAPMLRLAKSLSLTIRVVDPDHDFFPGKVDYSCPLLDVPMVLGLKPGTVTSVEPRFEPNRGHLEVSHTYLSADLPAMFAWRRRLSDLPPGLNVGLCWSSGGHMGTSRAAQAAKSIPLHWLKSLEMPGVNLVSLQKPRIPGPADDGGPRMVDWADELHDFADTAALIEALDLVISVDTAVAHLAGALGKPVWNFVRFSGYWPWLSAEAAGDPEKSIWYPTMKLVRQPSLANWAEPIERVTGWLAAEAKKAAA